MKRPQPIHLASAVTIVLLGLGAILAGFAGPLPEGLATAIGPPLTGTALQALIVLTLVAVGAVLAWEARHTTTSTLLGDRHPPEAPRNAPKLVGEDFGEERSAAIADIRLAERAYDETTPYEKLRDVIHRTYRFNRDCAPAEADGFIDAGIWTRDPVATAFLSDDIEYPTRFQLFVWARPADAYDVAVERTSAAVERFVTDELTPATPDEPFDATDESPRWVDRARSRIARTDGEQPTAEGD